MRFRTLIGFLLIFGFVWFLASTIAMNRDPVDISLAFVQTLNVELWMALLGAFGAGAALILVFDIAGGARRFARDFRARRLHRAHERTEDIYLHGLDDMVNGRYEQAVAQFDKVLAREPDHLNALIKRGDSLQSLERHREAAQSLERAIGESPEHLVALYSLSDVYIHLGDWERAEQVLERIIQIDPRTTVSAHRKLRDLKIRQKDWAAADELQPKIEKMVTLTAEKEKARKMWMGIRFELGREQLAKGRLKEAITTFQSVLKRDGEFVPAHLKLGEAHLKGGDTDEALAAWRTGYEATGSTELLAAVQNYYLTIERPEEAIGTWKQAIVLSENEAPLRYCLGKLYYRLFMLDEALKEFRLIEDTVSGLPPLHVYIARVLESKGDFKEALSKSKTVLGEVGGLMQDFNCGSCQARYAEWRDYCERCGNWNTVSLDVRAAQRPEPSILPAPTWSST
ncbi:MAG TPA: lipopolysaccharide assembly protein LapA domain-containing protein [Vicinamibacteria bacterium]|jgi:tetratricopeptide (TPR) repeat protein